MGAGARKAEAVPTTVAKVRNFMLGKEEEGVAPVLDVNRKGSCERVSLESRVAGGGKEQQEGPANGKQVIQGRRGGEAERRRRCARFSAQ